MSRVVVAERVDRDDADLTEISDLARVAGYEVVGELTQIREEDAAFHFGEGKAGESASLVTREDAIAVVFDNRLGPYQTYNIAQRLLDDAEVIDHFTLILEIFGQRANTRRVQLQVELAELRYELPCAETKTSLAKRDERPGFMGLGEYDESREQDIKAQISCIKNELDAVADKEETRCEQRCEFGFDLVVLTGYTNAGKSTLVQRLATDLEVGQNGEFHPNPDPTAEPQDKLFTTLGMATCRAEMDRRGVLLTDTVGFVSDLPRWLVESSESTLDSVYRTDFVLFIVDASEPAEEMCEKLVTSHDTLYERNEAPIVIVFNKVDKVEAKELEEKRVASSALTPNPVAVSGLTGENVEELADRVEGELPAWKRERLLLPMAGDTMSLVSWLYDHAHVEAKEYEGEQIHVKFEARPAIAEKARAKAAGLSASTSSA